jgi:hypothetical protein
MLATLILRGYFGQFRGQGKENRPDCPLPAIIRQPPLTVIKQCLSTSEQGFLTEFTGFHWPQEIAKITKKTNHKSPCSCVLSALSDEPDVDLSRIPPPLPKLTET